jgi:hypothetical protein
MARTSLNVYAPDISYVYDTIGDLDCLRVTDTQACDDAAQGQVAVPFYSCAIFLGLAKSGPGCADGALPRSAWIRATHDRRSR